MQLVLRSRHVVTPEGIRPASVLVRDGVIREVAEFDQAPAGAVPLDFGERVLFPGVVDTHVHVNEPGRTEWEGFDTATRAAAAGGVTTLVDMPLNSVPATTTPEALRAKRRAAEGRTRVDVGFWGGVVPGNADRLRTLREAGVLGFKCFLVPSGVDEFAHVGEADLRAALPVLAELGAPLLAHAELPGPLERAARAGEPAPPDSYAGWLRSRPPAAEVEAVELLVRLCREYGAPVHLVHLSSAEALHRVREAKEAGLPLTAETCPHYLHFAAEEIPDGATELKCAPPIREREHREALWGALGAGVLDLVASDHSPAPPEMKARETGDFLAAWGGIASLQLTLPVVWRGARERGYTLLHLAEWLSAAPARLAGLERKKGAIAPGCDADLVVFDPDTEFLVEPGHLHHRHPLSPYVGSILPGVVEATFLRGTLVYERGHFPAAPTGRLLLHTPG
jgi:allantoinase